MPYLDRTFSLNISRNCSVQLLRTSAPRIDGAPCPKCGSTRTVNRGWSHNRRKRQWACQECERRFSTLITKEA